MTLLTMLAYLMGQGKPKLSWKVILFLSKNVGLYGCTNISQDVTEPNKPGSLQLCKSVA